MSAVIPEKFIRNAFIDPIKSVLVIDDEYPVLEDLIQCALDDELHFTKFPKKKKEKARDLLGFAKTCRNPPYGWLVDVHDGENIDLEREKSIVKYLRERDLLILDYHLREDSPKLSIEILHELARSENFNLCIVYSDADPSTIFDEIVYRFISPRNFEKELTPLKRAEIKDFLEEWDVDDGAAVKKLKLEVTKTFREIWRIGTSKLRGAAGTPAKSIADLIEGRIAEKVAAKKEKAKENGKGKVKEVSPPLPSNQDIFDYLLDESQATLKLPTGKIASICKDDANVKWLRSDNLFVAIVKKSPNGAISLIDKLIEALGLWNPSPARLLLNRYRVSLDTKGGKVSDYALHQREREATWLSQLLDAGSADRQSQVETAIRRHWEILCDEVMTDVSGWANDLFSHLSELPDRKQWIADVLKVDIDDKNEIKDGTVAQNIFACSKTPSGSNLTTGHIIKWDNEYWVCLSPACDLVPDRKGAPDTPISFKAVRLHKKSREDALNLPLGSAIFLQLDGKEQAFFALVQKSDGVEGPDCREFRASKQGRFLPSERKFELIETEWDSEKNDVVSKRGDAWVVAQLRYEYALNYLQVLGANLTRIGLDLVKLPDHKKVVAPAVEPIAKPADATPKKEP